VLQEYIIGFLIAVWISVITVAVYTIHSTRIQNKKAIERIEKSYQDKFEIWKETELQSIISKERKKALETSRHVIKGKVSEHLAPYLPEFAEKYNPSESRFIGSPIDYLIFKNMSLVETLDEPIEVVLVDIKTGKSKLNKRQRRIRDAIENGRVSFDVINIE